MDEVLQHQNYCDYLWAVLASQILDVPIEIETCFPDIHQHWIGLNAYFGIIFLFHCLQV